MRSKDVNACAPHVEKSATRKYKTIQTDIVTTCERPLNSDFSTYAQPLLLNGSQEGNLVSHYLNFYFNCNIKFQRNVCASISAKRKCKRREFTTSNRVEISSKHRATYKLCRHGRRFIVQVHMRT